MPKSISRYLAALSDADMNNRAQAAEQLALLGPDAQPAAIALVLACGDEDETVRGWAASALENLGPPELADIEQLASLVEARSPDVGYWAATLLGRLKAAAAPALETLAQAAAGSPHPPVRQRAAWALGEIGTAAPPPRRRKAANNPDSRLARLS